VLDLNIDTEYKDWLLIPPALRYHQSQKGYGKPSWLGLGNHIWRFSDWNAVFVYMAIDHNLLYLNVRRFGDSSAQATLLERTTQIHCTLTARADDGYDYFG
jgi:hypothetical protein